MPPARKVDLLPKTLRDWLHTALKERGFGGYEELAAELNDKLSTEGLELTIGKSALHEYGAEFKEFAKWQSDAEAEMRAVLEEATLRDEIDATDVLFQQLTRLAFRLQMAMAREDGLPDAKGLKDLSTALNNLTRNADLRAKIVAEEDKRKSATLTAAVVAGDIDAEAAQKARQIMGLD